MSASSGPAGINRIALALVIVLTGACLYTLSLIYAASFFSNTLRDAGVQETVMIGSSRYLIASGTVAHDDARVGVIARYRALRLAYDVTLARRDPVFALPGSDSEALLRESDGLSLAEDSIAAAQASSSQRRTIFGLYPVSYLKAAAVAEMKRRVLLESPSEDAMDDYRFALRRAAAAKVSAVQTFDYAFSWAVGTKTINLGTWSGIISPTTTRAAIGVLRDDSVQERMTLRSRAWCDAGIMPSCVPIPPVRIPAIATSTRQLVVRRQAEDVRLLWSESGSQNASHAHGAILEHSACLPTLSPLRAYIFATPPTGYGTLSYGDDILFKRSDVSTTSPLMAYARGVLKMSYFPHNAFKFYGCPQEGIDFGAVVAIGRIAQFAQEHPGVASAQRALLLSAHDLPRERDARAYLIAALAAATSGAQRHDLEELALEYARRSAGLEDVIRDISHVQTLDSSDLTIISDLTPRTQFLTHSAFVTLLRSGRSDEAVLNALYAQEPVRAVIKTRSEYTFYSDLKTTVPRRVFIHDLRTFLTLERRMPSAAPETTSAAYSR